MTQTKQFSSTDSFLLAVNFRLEARNMRATILRLIGLMATVIGIAFKVWTVFQASVP